MVISFAKAQNKTDSLRRELRKKSGSERVDILNKLTIDSWLNYPDIAEQYAKEALFLARASGDSTKISKSLRLLGGVFLYQGFALEALDYNKQSLAIALSIKDSALINSSLNNIGFTYFNLNNYQSALEYLLRSLKVKELTGDEYGMEHTLNNIGLIYQRAKNHQKALSYFERGYQQAIKNDNNDLQIYSLNNSARSYIAQKRINKAKETLKKSLKIGKTTDNNIWKAVTLMEIGEIQFIENNYDSALDLLNKAITKQTAINDRKGLAKSHTLEAKIYLAQKNYDPVVKHLNKSDSLAKISNASEITLSNYIVYKELFLALNNFSRANEYVEMYLNKRDSLYTQVLDRNLSLIPGKLQEEENRIKFQDAEMQLKSERFQNLIYISFIILILPFSILLFMLYRRNKKINHSLEKQNDTIEAQKEEIETQKEYMEENFRELEIAKNLISNQRDELEVLNKQLEGKVDASTTELKKVNESLKATSLELDNFIYKSSHDIKGPLVRLMGICSLALKDITDEKSLDYFIMLDKATKRLNFIIDELKLISELNAKVIEVSRIPFDEIIEECKSEIAYIENISSINIKVDKQESIQLLSDIELVRLIIFNLLQNSFQILKSEQIADKEVMLSLFEEEDRVIIKLDLLHLKLRVEEISQLIDSLSKANKEFNNLSIGLYTIILCLNKLNGAFELKSGESGNTIFEVHIPKTEAINLQR
ncbi:hypothetical protein GCM10027429_09640 [Marivirga atlantica]|jgi:tetratricopeptide (TPR) repeat protein|uniref:histidine kinase n=1 Tax=Marivirga atlantica TaxID=1548457 RepID=A0A937A920_9BACT|nr:tetratricopeptide repeat protein [Marivirga atlantica]MBL0764576.1 tetratricopeptide repeat-containing sensor histidine kinase [Marivirga atlantica]